MYTQNVCNLGINSLPELVAIFEYVIVSRHFSPFIVDWLSTTFL